MQECDELERIEIELLLEGIYRYYGFDFRKYVFSSIRRRLWHRINIEKMGGISALQERVLRDPKLMETLISDFSITVTEMFRNPGFFSSLRNKIVPALKDQKLIRIWHAGCSTGEEVYSMAILLKEEGIYEKARIYATDMNEDSLKRAKKGFFPLARMQEYTKNYIEAGGTGYFSNYYTVQHEEVIFDPALMDHVVYAQHNLVTDGSFNEFHVIICRNVMIYFDKALQNQVHRLFYESLCTNGFLGLGNRESLSFTEYAKYYEEIDPIEKFYRKAR